MLLLRLIAAMIREGLLTLLFRKIYHWPAQLEHRTERMSLRWWRVKPELSGRVSDKARTSGVKLAVKPVA